MFFFTYLSRMKKIHHFEKSHQNVDDLFRLFIYDVQIYSTIILNANEKFYVFIGNFLSIDSHFDKIYNKLKQQIKNTIKKNRFSNRLSIISFKHKFKIALFCQSI